MGFVKYKTIILKYKSKGEKTGWSYIEVPADIAGKLKPGFRKSFRVKGMLDAHPIKGVSLLPMGDGAFIIPINAAMRKATGKSSGAMLNVQLTEDKVGYKINKDLLVCLSDEPDTLAFFKKMPGSHQKYFSKWVESARTDNTKIRRIAQTVNAMAKGLNFGEMLKSLKKDQP